MLKIREVSKNCLEITSEGKTRAVNIPEQLAFKVRRFKLKNKELLGSGIRLLNAGIKPGTWKIFSESKNITFLISTSDSGLTFIDFIEQRDPHDYSMGPIIKKAI